MNISYLLLSALPPVWRFWPLYILIFSSAAGLLWISGLVDVGELPNGDTAAVLFAGVVVAFVALLANAWSQWQTARISHALQALQQLRTDREYLINATTVTQAIAATPTAAWGSPLPPVLAHAFRDDAAPSSVDRPSFRDASIFLLNQYEFIAAATRSGAMDIVLIRATLEGPIRMLLQTYAGEIVRLRADRKKAFVNLIWLHRTMSGSSKPYLGPLNIGE